MLSVPVPLETAHTSASPRSRGAETGLYKLRGAEVGPLEGRGAETGLLGLRGAEAGPLESRGAETGLLELRGAEAGPLESRGTETGLLELRGAEAGPHFRGSRVLPLHRHLGYATAEM